MSEYKAVLLLMVVGLVLFSLYLIFTGQVGDTLTLIQDRFTNVVNNVFGKIDGNVGAGSGGQ